MLTKNGQFTRFTLHRSMPHVGRPDRANEVDTRITLKSCEDLFVIWIRWRHIGIVLLLLTPLRFSALHFESP